MKTKVLFFIAIFLLGSGINLIHGNPSPEKDKIIKKNVSKKITEAGESGYNSILVVTDNEESDLDAAFALATETAGLSNKTVVAMVNRELEDNNELVEKYYLQRLTLPYVLILSSNGSAMGGVVPGKVTAGQLAAFIPTGCANKVIEAKTDGKASYLFVPSDDEETNTAWMKVINESIANPNVNAEMISVNPDDGSEASFLAKLGYNESLPLPMLVVLNKDSKITARYTSIPDAGTISLAASKVVSSGCGSSCPSSKSCAGKKSSCGSK
jgi:hypothetical protein